MRTRSAVVVAAGGRLRQLDCRPPLTIRKVGSASADTCALCLVGSAAGPLEGDELELCFALEDGARATLQASGASLAQGGASSYATTVRLGADAWLHARPGPLIVTAHARVDVRLHLDVAVGAHVDWREIVVLGRSDEEPGAATLHWDVTREQRPVLRQRIDLGVGGWRGVRDGHRVMATAFVSGPDVIARTVVHSPTAVAARLDEHTLLATVLAADSATAQRDLDVLCGAQGERAS